ncbi:MAG: hybrid sensor histidine kinase/response regulator [Panacagrimonas sp.]
MSESEHERLQVGVDAPLRSIEGELIALIAANEHRLKHFTVFGSAGATTILLMNVPAFYALGWWLLITTTLYGRVKLIDRARHDPALSDPQRLRLIFWLRTWTAMVQSLLMGFVPFVPVHVGALLSIYLAGMCTGNTANTAGYRPVVTAYNCIAMGALSCAWEFTPDPARGWLDRLLFVVLIAVYTKVLLGFASGTYQVFVESYRIRLERWDLNQRLAAALATAEAASRAKTRFLASASHDLRQPIHALSLFSGSMQMRPLDPRSAAIAQQIDKSVKVLGAQLDALLDISRLDAGVVRSSIESIDLSGVLSQLAEEYRPQAEHKGLRLSLSSPEELWVRSDSLLLRRVLANLLSNAIKFTGEGLVELAAERSSTGCRVWIRDTGPGIPVEEQERVFEEFYQLGNAERDRARGLGLGLSIARRLSELLQLNLRMESVEGSGTRFTLELPLARPQEQPIPRLTEEDGPAIQGIDVLVVDDEEDVRLGMRTLLEEMGFGVQVAASTDGAVECSRTFTPSIVLADFRLAGADDGLKTVRALRRVWPELPALLVSGDTAPDRLREALTEGIELLHKPVAADLLRESVLKAVAAHAAVS